MSRRCEASPPGTGPNAPQDCLVADGYGDEIIVLRIASAARVSFVHVRYSGCDHHGFDDGVTVRQLTRAALQAVVGGANWTTSWDGSVNEVMRPAGS